MQLYNWTEQHQIDVVAGWYGEWNDIQHCKPGHFIDRIWVYNQQPQGPKFNDLAIVGLYARCSLPSNRTQTSDIGII